MRTKLRGNERGSVLLETAFTLPIILLVSIGIFEFGRAYQTAQVLTNAAREGARIAILMDKTDEDVAVVVRKYMEDGGLPQHATAGVAIDRSVPMGTNTGSRITVTYPFSFMFLNGAMNLVTKGSTTGQPLTLTSVALMRNEI